MPCLHDGVLLAVTDVTFEGVLLRLVTHFIGVFTQPLSASWYLLFLFSFFEVYQTAFAGQPK